MQNAQRYFKKYQKARTTREIAAEQKEKTLKELDYLEGTLLDVGKCIGESELEEIRQDLMRTGYIRKGVNRRQQKALPKSKPYHYRSTDGIDIYVGKNAAQNDRLTGDARPNETWLHAKDMPGSHVIIRKEGEIPRQTLLEAAILAAWYSRGRIPLACRLTTRPPLRQEARRRRSRHGHLHQPADAFHDGQRKRRAENSAGGRMMGSSRKVGKQTRT